MGNLKIQVALLCLVGAMFLSSCGDSPAPADKPVAVDSTKPRWIDPQRGKMYGKVNYVQIPLTAIENHILGPVKSVRYIDYSISEKDGGRVISDSGYNVYDKYGHLIDQNEYDKDGKLKWHCVYGYDAQNNATEWDINVPSAKMLSKVTFRYDEKGNKIEENSIDTNKMYSSKVFYKYDDKQNLVEERRQMGAKGKAWVSTFKYDSRGFQTEYVMKDETGKFVSKMTQEYDNDGNKLSGANYSSDTGIEGRWKAVLDSKGRTIEMSDYKPDGAVSKLTKYKYDDWDNVTESITYRPDGSIDTAGFNYYTEFEYDSHGNPTKETWYKLKDGKKVVTDIAEKKYEYY